jgi:hypothetical protein
MCGVFGIEAHIAAAKRTPSGIFARLESALAHSGLAH